MQQQQVHRQQTLSPSQFQLLPQSKVRVNVPLGVAPGQPFGVNVNGRMFTVRCPPGVVPGQPIQIQVPAAALQPQLPPQPPPQLPPTVQQLQQKQMQQVQQQQTHSPSQFQPLPQSRVLERPSATWRF